MERVIETPTPTTPSIKVEEVEEQVRPPQPIHCVLLPDGSMTLEEVTFCGLPRNLINPHWKTCTEVGDFGDWLVCPLCKRPVCQECLRVWRLWMDTHYPLGRGDPWVIDGPGWKADVDR